MRSAPAVASELRQAALDWLAEPFPAKKAAGVTALARAWAAGGLPVDAAAVLVPSLPLPGRPGRPILVPPNAVRRRAMATLEGRAAMLHALAHIEFNAINLALDAVWRFPGLPTDYYADWLRVAGEEAQHFSLLAEHLASLGYAYGDFEAHNGLWEMADRTRDDVLARIALVPRTLEARGLDVSPGIRDRFAQVGDQAAVAILEVILRDEIGHVRIGNRWYAWLCEARGLEPIATYRNLAIAYQAPPLRGPFNLPARREAGFTAAELDALKASPGDPA